MKKSELKKIIKEQINMIILLYYIKKDYELKSHNIIDAKKLVELILQYLKIPYNCIKYVGDKYSLLELKNIIQYHILTGFIANDGNKFYLYIQYIRK